MTRCTGAAVGAAALVVLTSACSAPWATSADCADPPLVVVSADEFGAPAAVELWQPDGRSEVLTAAPVDAGPAVSPDGRTVAIALGEGPWSDSTGYAGSRVASVSVSTGRVTVLSADIPATRVDQLQWSSDGSEVAFVRRGFDPAEFLAVGVEDRRERLLLDAREGQGPFAWSPDGREVLVPSPTVDPRTAPRQEVELRRYAVDTGEYEVVPTPHTVIRELSWSPDGRWVALHADIPGTFRTRVHVLDVEAGASRPVDRRRGTPEGMTWSGPHLVYTYDVSAPDDELLLMRWDSRTGERARVDRAGVERFHAFRGAVSAPACPGRP